MSNIVFLHVPKTGGTYTRYEHKKNLSPIHPIKNLGHVFISENKVDVPSLSKASIKYMPRSELKNKFVFTNVRNIFEWLVSWAGHMGCWNTVCGLEQTL